MNDLSIALGELLKHGDVCLSNSVRPLTPRPVICICDCRAAYREQDVGAIAEDNETAILYAWADLKDGRFLPF